MAYSIYFMKMQLLSRRWTMSDKEALQIETMSTFIVLCHSEVFLWSRISTIAPVVDITYLSYMTEYETLDEEIAKEVIKSVMNHLWYLVTEEIVIFSIFEESLSPTLRRAMVDKLLSIPRPITFRSGKPKFPLISPPDPKDCTNVLLSLIGERSWLIFYLLMLDGSDLDWMQAPVDCWEKMVGFQNVNPLFTPLRSLMTALKEA
jgi:hypothetical protein